ncbi:hypothetical protein J2T12_003751 [Paenibacillus anaericanus]|nr:hypothetical protein [Paenibacillus anaericanus]
MFIENYIFQELATSYKSVFLHVTDLMALGLQEGFGEAESVDNSYEAKPVEPRQTPLKLLGFVHTRALAVI